MRNLYKTTALVTAFTAMEHLIGFLYRIVLSRTLGAEGLGVFQVALSVYAVFLTLSSSGLPVTLSRTISKHRSLNNPSRTHAAVTAAVCIVLLFSLPVTLLLFVLRTPFSRIFADERSADLFYILLFGLTFTALYTVIRGSFWGKRRFFAYSAVELVEEILTVFIGILLIVVIPAGASPVNKAAIAVLASHTLSFALALSYYLMTGGRFASPRHEFLPLLKSSLPVTSMRASSSFISSIISVLFPVRLMAAGFSSAFAMREYGIVFGMVMPVLSLPSTFIGSIALVLVPELAECYYKKQQEKLTLLAEKALRVTLYICFLLIPLLFACGESVGVLLYSSPESGTLITLSAALVLPMSLTLLTTSMLNSMNGEKQTLFFFLAGSAAMLLCVWILPRFLGGAALIIGMALNYSISAACALVLLKKRTNYRMGRYTLKILLAALLAAGAGWGMKILLFRVMGCFPATLLIALFVLALQLLLSWALKLFDLKAVFLKFLPKKGRGKNEKKYCAPAQNMLK